MKWFDNSCLVGASNNVTTEFKFKHKMPKRWGSDIPVDYFKDHKCKLPRQKIAQRIVCGRLRWWILNLTTVSISDARAKAMFRSYASFKAEKYRQFKHYPFTIHPFTKLRLYFEMFLVVIIYMWYIASSVHLSEHPFDSKMDICHGFGLIIDILFSIHIIMNFFTGYVEGDTQKRVELNLKRIFWHYIRTWFFPDILASAIRMTLYIPGMSWRAMIIFEYFKVTILARTFTYTNNFIRAMDLGITMEVLIKIWLALTTYLSWNMMFQYAVEFYFKDDFNILGTRSCSWMTVCVMWNQTAVLKFTYSFKSAVGMLRKSSNYSLLREGACVEVFIIISWIIGQMLMFHSAFSYFIILLARESAKMKYYIMTKVVRKYMKHKKLPKKLQQIILKYYSVKFQTYFCVESRLLETVTGQLRQDIIMHTRHHLLQKVQYLKNLPRSLQIQVAMKLKAEVFVAGDVIYKINTVGNSLFFISRGTVVIYTASGKEYRRVEDGEFFGEGSLILSSASCHKIRYTTAVALSNCELYRLDGEDFKTSLACYPMLYEEMKKAAIWKYQRLQMVEERF